MSEPQQNKGNERTENNHDQTTRKEKIEQKGPYKRIVIVGIPDYDDINRGTIEEMCTKYGRVNTVELRRGFKSGALKAFVTFYNELDAEFAVYRLYGYEYRGRLLKSFPAPLTEEEKRKRKEEQLERERSRLAGPEKKKKMLISRNVLFAFLHLLIPLLI